MDIPNSNYTISQHATTCVLLIIHIDLLRNNLVQYYKLICNVKLFSNQQCP